MYPRFEVDQNRPIDLICMGRVAVDLYAEQIGCDLSDAQSFKKYLGGCAGNIAVGAARLGLKCMMYSCVGQDEMGIFLKKTLHKEGVATDLLAETPDHLTALVLLGIKPPYDFPLMFYRNDCADMQLKADQISDETLIQAKAILITGTGLSTELIRRETLEVIRRARHAGTKVILDLDFRPVLWGLTSIANGETRFIADNQVSQTYQSILGDCDLIVGTEEELAIAAGGGGVEQLRQFSDAPLVVKSGEQGATIYFTTQDVLHSAPFKVEVLNVLGAGDAFMSGLLSGLLRNTSWEVAVQRANASGAIVVTRHGCSPAMPYMQELDALINQSLAITAKSSQPGLIHHPHGFEVGLNPIATLASSQPDCELYFSSIKLNKGQEYCCNARYEFAALLMIGRVRFHYADQQHQAERSDYFAQMPKALHCAAQTKAWIEALTDCELLLIETENTQYFDPVFFDEHNCLEIDARGKNLLEDTSHRQVRTLFDKRNRPQSNLVLGEIITYQGRWSSYPSHYHDQAELYHYRFSEPQGFAFAEQGNKVLRVGHYDTYSIAAGEAHAHCTAPGYALYTLWCIRHLPANPYLVPTFDTAHDWTRTNAANLRVWNKME